MSELIEQQVVEHLQLLLGQYQQMDRLADEMVDRRQQAQSIDAQLDQLRAGREQISAIESSATEIMQHYRETREHASPTVNGLTEETKQLIKKLMLKVANLEQSARQSYHQLIPQIDRGVRGNQMKQAYGSAPS